MDKDTRRCTVPDCRAPAAGELYCQAHAVHEETARQALRALENSPDAPDLHVSLATAYRHLGQYERALAEYQQAVRLAPADGGARFWLGRTYILTGDLLAATEECLALDELDPDRAVDLVSAIQEYSNLAISFEAGPGDAIETAVIIRGAPTSSVGVNAEYQYLRQQFGIRNVDWQLAGQSLLHTADRSYDKMEIVLADGSRRVVFFEITEFYPQQNAGTTDGAAAPSIPSKPKQWWQFWK